jgi:hypothetical protein
VKEVEDNANSVRKEELQAAAMGPGVSHEETEEMEDDDEDEDEEEDEGIF